MAGQESRHLRPHVGKRVRVDWDDGTSDTGRLLELRAGGPRVQVGEPPNVKGLRTVAAWRITVLEDQGPA